MTTPKLNSEFAGMEGKTAVMDSRGHLHESQVPLYMREGGEAEIEMRRKELETYVKLLREYPDIIRRTLICLNPFTIEPDEVGHTEATAVKEWWTSKGTRHCLLQWLVQNPHEVNGKYNNWSCGGLGSRWADCDINGRRCRLAFYSRKFNPSSFPEEVVDKTKNYAIMIDPTN